MIKSSSAHAVAADLPFNLPYAKAGFIISGVETQDATNDNAIGLVIAPYTEGRFGSNDKYYVLPKGSIDKGEDVLTAAIRETSEETGVDISSLIGPEGIAALREGKTISPYPSPGYPGVIIKSINPKALDLTYNSREDNRQRTALFHVEVQGIEHLRDALKNPQNRNAPLTRNEQTSRRPDFGTPGYNYRIKQVDFPVRSIINGTPAQYPNFQERLNWIRQMKMPDAPWAKGKGGTPLVLKNKMGEEIAVNDGWFTDLETKFLRKYHSKDLHTNQISGPNDWQNFLNQLTPKNRNLILKAADAIKEHLYALDILRGDKDLLKFDTKDCPMMFYQEGADLMPMDSYLHSCILNATQRSDFRRAFCGDTPRSQEEKRSVLERISGSQMAGVVWAAGTQNTKNIAEVANMCNARDFPKTRGYIWGAPVRRTATASEVKKNDLATNQPLTKTLGSELISVFEEMKQCEVPATEVANVIPHGRTTAAANKHVA